MADRFVSGFPIDYDPVLLLMPFGLPLVLIYLMDTLPFGVQQLVGFRSARLDLSIPFTFLRPAILSPLSDIAI